MNLTLTRSWKTDKSNIGRLAVNVNPFCYTLELPDGDPRRIPVGGPYPVILDWSKKFKAMMPHIVIPGRTDVDRFHIGNFPKEVEGCVAVGWERGIDALSSSAYAFEALCTEFCKAWMNKENITLEAKG